MENIAYTIKWSALLLVVVLLFMFDVQRGNKFDAIVGLCAGIYCTYKLLG